MSETIPYDKDLIQCDGQEMLPIAIRPNRISRWNNEELKTKWSLLGKKVVRKLMVDRNFYPTSTEIDSDDIDKIKDPDLRYALRFQDAAKNAGSFYHTPYASSSHFVNVYATNNGFDSKYTGSSYTGISENGVDHFMENLKRFDPNYTGNSDDL